METKFYSYMQELMEKYEELKIPNKYSLQEVDHILKKSIWQLNLKKGF